MKAFWYWFLENEQWIIDRIKGPDAGEVVWALDAQLKPIFDYFKGEIEFELGFNNGQGEFFFFDLNSRGLRSDAEALSDRMPDALRDHWKMIIEH